MSTENNMDISYMITREDMKKMVAEGKKTAIRRQKRFGDIGDTFELDGNTYEITNVYEQQLQDITDEQARQEGFADLEAYQQSITSIHEDAVWVPKLKVWAHEFKAV